MSVFNRPMKVLALVAVSIAMPTLGSASTMSLIDVSGPLDFSQPTGPDQTFDSVAATFSLGSDVSGASLSLDILCVLGPCAGQFYLTSSDVSAGSPSLLDLVDVSVFNVATDFGGASAIGFSGLDLMAGTYSLQMTFQSGLGGWLGSSVPNTTSLPGFSVGGAVSYRADNPLLPFFSSSQPLGYAPSFTLTGTLPNSPTAVPLPATVWLSLGALGLLWRRGAT